MTGRWEGRRKKEDNLDQREDTVLKRAVLEVGKGCGGKERELVDGGTTLIEIGPAYDVVCIGSENTTRVIEHSSYW